MSDNTFMLKDMFFKDAVDFTTKFSGAWSAASLSSLQVRLKKEGDRISFPSAMEEIISCAQSFMRIKIEDILLPAWKKYLSLRKYLDREKYPPDKTAMVPVAEHTVKSEHHPFVEFLIDDRPVGRINFTIKVSLLLKGLILVINDGKIKGIKVGECSAKGMVSCENFLLVDKTSETIPLPGTISLGEGVPLW